MKADEILIKKKKIKNPTLVTGKIACHAVKPKIKGISPVGAHTVPTQYAPHISFKRLFFNVFMGQSAVELRRIVFSEHGTALPRKKTLFPEAFSH